jgi:hypothetical protein
MSFVVLLPVARMRMDTHMTMPAILEADGIGSEHRKSAFGERNSEYLQGFSASPQTSLLPRCRSPLCWW